MNLSKKVLGQIGLATLLALAGMSVAQAAIFDCTADLEWAPWPGSVMPAHPITQISDSVVADNISQAYTKVYPSFNGKVGGDPAFQDYAIVEINCWQRVVPGDM